jgi:c-di-GMP-binding flagellar brake protein YcgR
VEGWDETMSAKERRKALRVDAALPISISGGPEPAEGKTLNISTNGVYFESPRAIEPLTKVRMELMLPVLEGGTDKEMGVSFDGVVVRTNLDSSDPNVQRYRIAVFFTHVSQASQKVLDGFIKRRLSA